MLIDTHCHLDAPAFDGEREQIVQNARHAGVSVMIVPSVAPSNFAVVQALAHSEKGVGYALGIHPLFVPNQSEQALVALADALNEARDDPKLVAVGEIGLDYFIQGIDPVKQERFYHQQLKLAARFDLPVILHVRKSADRLLKYLRMTPVNGGIAHAFNGSSQQAHHFLEMNFALGFGGSLTYARALQIRRHVTTLAPTAHVLETDSPDIAPEWIANQRNEPAELAQIATQFAQLRGETVEAVLTQTAQNAARVLPRLTNLISEVG